MITLTDLAHTEVRRIKTAQSLAEATGVRLVILGGGCSGMQYALSLEANVRPEHDTVFRRNETGGRETGGGETGGRETGGGEASGGEASGEADSATDDVPIITERKFAPHLEGTVIDFQNGPMAHGFTITNPNFPSTGGCPGCGG